MDRFLVALGLMASIAGCDSKVPPGDPTGAEIWASYGGFCDGPCEQRALYLDGSTLDFRRTKGDELLDWGDGTLTDAGRTEYEEASAELAGKDTSMLHVCSPADGIDARVTLADGDTTLDYCILDDVGAPMKRIDTFFDKLLDGIENCSSNEWVDAC